ncbi:MAG: hypothetical protein J3R72DRAFT_527151 [Linnemannia gamsii]|nr:MAG: hypothetical protein J3R72DRAFT_527151 [Linnemannia gamsii]
MTVEISGRDLDYIRNRRPNYLQHEVALVVYGGAASGEHFAHKQKDRPTQTQATSMTGYTLDKFLDRLVVRMESIDAEIYDAKKKRATYVLNRSKAYYDDDKEVADKNIAALDEQLRVLTTSLIDQAHATPQLSLTPTPTIIPMTNYNLDKFLDRLVLRMEDLDKEIIDLTRKRDSEYNQRYSDNMEDQAHTIRTVAMWNEHIQVLLNSLHTIECTVESVLKFQVNTKNKTA